MSDSTLAGVAPIQKVGANGRAVAQPPGPEEAARKFEAYMLKFLLTQMRKTVGEGGLLKGDSTRSYQSMIDDALATRAAENGAFGLAEQLLRSWEAAEPEPDR